MDLISSYLGLKFTMFFKRSKDKSSLFFFFFFFVGTIFNSYIFLNFLESDSIFLHKDNLLVFLFVLLFILTLVRKFFPVYIPLVKRISTHYPRSAVFRYCFNLLDDVLSFYLLNSLFFIFILVIFSPEFTLAKGIKLFIILIEAIILRRLLHVMIEQKFKIHILRILSMACLIFLFIYGNTFYPFYTLKVNPTDILFIILLLIAGYSYEEKFSVYNIVKDRGIITRNFTLNLILNQTLARRSLYIGLIIKMILLGTITFGFYKNGNYSSFFIIYLFISPALIFTYAFNNTWGLYRNCWITFDKTINNAMQLFWFQASLISIVLIPDSIITVLFLSFNKAIALNGLIAYLLSTPLLVILSFYWSVYFPFRLEEQFNLKPSTSIVSSGVTIIIVLSFLPLQFSNWFYALIPVYIFLAFILYINMNDFYKSNRIRIYSALFK